MNPTRVLFVCTGNICRSPTADGVLRHHAPHLQVDSAGTHGYHIGEAPDPRTVEVARTRGYDLSPLRARKVGLADFQDFDLILAMDTGHLKALQAIRPVGSHAEVALFLDHAGMGPRNVPDPYYGTARDFEHVLDLVEEAVAAFQAKWKYASEDMAS